MNLQDRIHEVMTSLIVQGWTAAGELFPAVLRSAALKGLQRSHERLDDHQARKVLSQMVNAGRVRKKLALTGERPLRIGQIPLAPMRSRSPATVKGEAFISRPLDGIAWADIVLVANGFPICLVRIFRHEEDMEEWFSSPLRHLHGCGEMHGFIQLFVFTTLRETRIFSDLDCAGIENTISWADAGNRPIADFDGVCRAILAPHDLVDLACNFMMTCQPDNKGMDETAALMVLRPYQYHASRMIVERLFDFLHDPTIRGGYISHSTGSGKSITLLRTAMNIVAGHGLPPGHPYSKVVILVDRRDLEDQIGDSLRSFYPCLAAQDPSGARNLRRRLESTREEDRIIVTTVGVMAGVGQIPRLRGRLVFLADECHRSHAGKWHEQLRQNFPQSPIIGVSGTPLHLENSRAPQAMTRQVFGEEIHRYLISHAMRDGMVVPFRMFHVGDENCIDLMNEGDVREVVNYIGENHAFLTDDGRFGAMITASRVESISAIYKEMLRRRSRGDMPLKIAVSVSASGSPEGADTDKETIGRAREILMSQALQDHARQFGLSAEKIHEMSRNNYAEYRRDVADRIRREGPESLDILLVVGQFITGFDAPRVNTVYVLRDCEPHNIIQAISRGNRPASEKFASNAVFFNISKKKVRNALELYCSEDVEGLDRYGIVIPYVQKLGEVRSAMKGFLATAPTRLACARSARNSDESLRLLEALNDESRQISSNLRQLAYYPEFRKDPPDMPISEFDILRQRIRTLVSERQEKETIEPAPALQEDAVPVLLDHETLVEMVRTADLARFQKSLERLDWEQGGNSPSNVWNSLCSMDRALPPHERPSLAQIMKIFSEFYAGKRIGYIRHLAQQEDCNPKKTLAIVLPAILARTPIGLPDLRHAWGDAEDAARRLKLLGQVEDICEMVAGRYPPLAHEIPDQHV